jgi:hypothetical protein
MVIIQLYSNKFIYLPNSYYNFLEITIVPLVGTYFHSSSLSSINLEGSNKEHDNTMWPRP